jgi:hypothetical protein
LIGGTCRKHIRKIRQAYNILFGKNWRKGLLVGIKYGWDIIETLCWDLSTVWSVYETHNVPGTASIPSFRWLVRCQVLVSIPTTVTQNSSIIMETNYLKTRVQATSDIPCILHILQTADSVRHNVPIMNQTLSQTFRESNGKIMWNEFQGSSSSGCWMIQQREYRAQWRASLNAVIKVSVPWEMGLFLTSWATVS